MSTAAAPGMSTRAVNGIVAALLALHLALLWQVSAHNSVAFDEGFHLSGGVEALVRADKVKMLGIFNKQIGRAHV